MGKIIIFLIIIATIYFLFVKTNKKEIQKDSEENEFVQCENCKTFVLKKEAIEKNGKYYCKECNADS
ncbi:conserved hypothetical protein [Lebetimonas natsushimae]|uniref:Uncharacterized protein n=1 Tax=Lebetimonas natsushimae TaxID=1936991 RepID=A0A292YDH1_9BACT|nr:PP0621 family protein [Lebetimonas natsushimae]GAX87264.1 conserved hypothetical protein [Lebetimonas natsushimae]